jgi:hypothetical protein
MKRLFRLIVILVMCFSCVACQTTPKTKPLTEMTDEEQRAVYMNGPIATPQKEHHALNTALGVVCAILIAIPIVYVTNLAASGKQVHVGK